MVNITTLAVQLGATLKAQNLTLVLAESCTGGMVSQAVTSIPGSSAWFDRAFIAYSNQSKMDCLQVLSATLEQFGAVSDQVAVEMALGNIYSILRNDKNDTLEIDQEKSIRLVSASITGIAGPAVVKTTLKANLGIDLNNKSSLDENLEKPVGLVCFGFVVKNKVSASTQHFKGTRRQIRQQATQYVITQLIKLLH